MVSLGLNPAPENLCRVSCKLVFGSGTPAGPAAIASILPPRKGIEIAGDEQLTTVIATLKARRSATVISIKGHEKDGRGEPT
jgi:hypothetical protein